MQSEVRDESNESGFKIICHYRQAVAWRKKTFIWWWNRFLKNGATFLQLREKNATHEQQCRGSKKNQTDCGKNIMCRLLSNDDIWAAKGSRCGRVHIGQSDMDYEQARKILGPDKIIGMTAKTVEQAVQAEKLGADYIGVGAVFHTTTKQDAKDMSRETLAAITKSVSIPIVAIGGITYDNMDSLKDTGVAGVSVISAIFAKEDEGAAAAALRKKADTLFGAARSLIFDMDGTLLDSMPYWRRLAREYATKKGAVLPPDFDEKTYTMDLNECSDYFIKELGIAGNRENMQKEVLEMIREHYKKDIRMKPGMKELIEREYQKRKQDVYFYNI